MRTVWSIFSPSPSLLNVLQFLGGTLLQQKCKSDPIPHPRQQILQQYFSLIVNQF